MELQLGMSCPFLYLQPALRSLWAAAKTGAAVERYPVEQASAALQLLYQVYSAALRLLHQVYLVLLLQALAKATVLWHYPQAAFARLPRHTSAVPTETVGASRLHVHRHAANYDVPVPLW